MFTQTVTRALSRLSLDHRGADPHPRQPTLMLLLKAHDTAVIEGMSRACCHGPAIYP